MAEQGDIEGLEPTLNAEAGLTVASAQAAGSHGFVDNALHAGFISKQTPLPATERTEVPHIPQQAQTKAADEAIRNLEVEQAEVREPVLGSEAGSTTGAAQAAHGYADPALHAGFISKQTPRS